ncbi:2-methylaconitate cis-trans isomerase PrpF family protein [Nitratireductor indicus]|uniref:PrpF family protein n=1 Tax=Nitratireductor indicus C115 TaxID=1231190 RepID=K2PNC0_9HYPH|nr:PrpF domain-containing protein [Nitratireductor indicus]EKF42567.1 PrpF family protein [Nitratireductor indicus C115]MDS1138056.1 PrpF domain-containing protein [Nitratireductor indicus]SFQ57422.1 hypothetical protein SAMN05216176_106215 [Nitratireductor indicus]
MTLMRVPAAFIRGGTSKAVVFRRSDLPEEAAWPALFRAVLGSPDPNGRQLDGMGGGISSLSKICVVGPSSRADADVDYTFAQVSVTGTTVDFSGNCGNMSSAIGPFAVEEGLVSAPANGQTVVRIHNTNSGKIIHSRFEMRDGAAVVDGDFALPGVAGTGAPVELAFQDPAGTRGNGLLPAGAAVVELALSDGGTIAATAVDSATPAVFVRAADLGADCGALPQDIDADAGLMARLEEVRRAASVAMGIAPDLEQAGAIIAIPKIAMVGPADAFRTLAGESIASEGHDILVRMISAGQAHRAIPITGALALASAATVEGGIVADCLSDGADAGRLRLGTPSGVITVGAETQDGRILSAKVIRTQRRLMEGTVCVRGSLAFPKAETAQ